VDPANDLDKLDAEAAEHGSTLAFRLCEDAEEVEPVFMHLEQDEREGAVLLALTDRNGLSLGRYVIARERLTAALIDLLRQSPGVPADEPQA
jgi:hypothetical protein